MKSDIEYNRLISLVLEQGTRKSNRTGVDTRGVFGAMAKFDFSDGFPILTTKKIYFHSIKHELLWFLNGQTHIRYLVNNSVNIWNDDAYRHYKKVSEHHQLSKEDFIEKVRVNQCDPMTGFDCGELGHGTYGSAWRNFNGTDQIKRAINAINTNPNDRRIIVSAWNPSLIDEIALPPCHVMFQFNVVDNHLNCCMFQRSADLFLGVPFNLSSYALLIELIALATRKVPGTLTMMFGDLHIYENHFDAIQEQSKRTPKTYPIPFVSIEGNTEQYYGTEILNIKAEAISLIGYTSHPPLKGTLNVG